MKTIHITVDIKVPTMPNFFLDSSGKLFPISGVTDKGLQEIGEEWTRDLIAKAQKSVKKQKK